MTVVIFHCKAGEIRKNTNEYFKSFLHIFYVVLRQGSKELDVLCKSWYFETRNQLYHFENDFLLWISRTISSLSVIFFMFIWLQNISKDEWCYIEKVILWRFMYESRKCYKFQSLLKRFMYSMKCSIMTMLPQILSKHFEKNFSIFIWRQRII